MENFIPVLEIDDENIVPPVEDQDEPVTPPVDSDNEEEEEEEEEEKEKFVYTPPEDDEDEDESETDTEEAQVNAAYQLFVEKGYVSKQENAPKTWDELNTEIDKLPEEIAAAMLESVPPVAQNLIEFVLNSGESLTVDGLKGFFQKHLDLVADSDTEFVDEDAAEVYIKKALGKTGLKEREIDFAIQALKDDEELLNRANEFKAEETAAKQAAIEAEKEANKNKEIQRKENTKKYWANVSNALVETKWKPNKQKEVYDMLVNNKPSQVIGEIYKNPAALVQLADILSYYDVDKGQFDLTKFKQQVVTKEVEKGKENILRDGFSTVFKSKTGKLPGNNNENLTPII